jgi:hypothetical protein
MVGNSLRIPTDDAGEDAVQAFRQKILEHQNLGLMQRPDPEDVEALKDVYRALGMPEDTSGYQAPEGVDPEAFGSLATAAHELGLTKTQFENLSAKHAQLAHEQMQRVEQERQAGLSQLQGEWGLAFKEKQDRALTMVQQLGGHPALEQALANTQVDAATLRLLDTIATQMGSEGSQLASQIGQVKQQTPDELRQRRNEITQRLLNEDNLTPNQRQDLQNKLINLSEQLLAVNG